LNDVRREARDEVLADRGGWCCTSAVSKFGGVLQPVSKHRLVTLMILTFVAIAACIQIPLHHPSQLEVGVGIARLIGLVAVAVFWAVSRIAHPGRR
jgi:hypothetical protein